MNVWMEPYGKQLDTSETLHHAQHSSTRLNSVLCIVWHYIQYCVNNTKKVPKIHAVFFCVDIED